MKAWLCENFGPPSGLRLTDRPSRAPGADEVRIRIDSAAVNFPDLLSISGTYPVKSAAPFIPGIEGDRVEMMLGWIAEGRLRPHIHQRFPFDRCVEALEALAARKIVGKGVIVIRSGQGMTA